MGGEFGVTFLGVEISEKERTKGEKGTDEEERRKPQIEHQGKGD